MLLYGNGGHASVIIDCLRDLKVTLNGIFNDVENSGLLNPQHTISPYNSDFFKDDEIVISIGNNIQRKLVSGNITHRFGNVIHPSAIISSSSEIGLGTVVVHQSLIQSYSIIGMHVILNSRCLVEHDCIISDYVHIGPQATICGGVKINEGTLVGAGAVIIPNLTIGKWAVVGAGAVVIKNVPDFAVVVGNPASIIGYQNV